MHIRRLHTKPQTTNKHLPLTAVQLHSVDLLVVGARTRYLKNGSVHLSIEYYTPLALTSPPRRVITYITEGDLREAFLAQLSHLSLPPSEPVRSTSKLDVIVTEAFKSLFLFKPPLSLGQPRSGQSRRHNGPNRWRVQWVVKIDKSV